MAFYLVTLLFVIIVARMVLVEGLASHERILQPLRRAELVLLILQQSHLLQRLVGLPDGQMLDHHQVHHVGFKFRNQDLLRLELICLLGSASDTT